MKTKQQTISFLGMLLLIGCVSIASIGCSEQHQTERAEVRITSEGFPLLYGNDVCAWSGDTLETVRHGGQILLRDGTDLRFKSAESLAAYYLEMSSHAEITSLMIVDFAHGRKLLPVDKLMYLNSRNRPSPGGLFITPVDASNQRMLTYIHDAYPGTYLTWDQLLDKVQGQR